MNTMYGGKRAYTNSNCTGQQCVVITSVRRLLAATAQRDAASDWSRNTATNAKPRTPCSGAFRANCFLPCFHGLDQLAPPGGAQPNWQLTRVDYVTRAAPERVVQKRLERFHSASVGRCCRANKRKLHDPLVVLGVSVFDIASKELVERALHERRRGWRRQLQHLPYAARACLEGIHSVLFLSHRCQPAGSLG